MKYSLLLVYFVLSFFKGLASCDKKTAVFVRPDTINNIDNNPHPTGSKMKIKIGTGTFTAALYDNATAAAFKSLLPMTLNMVELNRNEKYVDLSRDLPTNASNPGTIQTGDLMLF